MLSYIINVQQDNRFLYSSIEPGQPLPSIPHPLIRGNRIQRHTGSGFTWLTFNYNYGSLMPINCHIAALVTIRGDWGLMRSISQNLPKIKKNKKKKHQKLRMYGKRAARDFYLLEKRQNLELCCNRVITFGYSWAIIHFNYDQSGLSPCVIWIISVSLSPSVIGEWHVTIIAIIGYRIFYDSIMTNYKVLCSWRSVIVHKFARYIISG